LNPDDAPAPIPRKTIPRKKLVLIAIAVAVLLAVGGAGFALLHGRAKHASPAIAKSSSSAASATTSATGSSAEKGSSAENGGSATTGSAAGCRGVVRDLYKQALTDDPSVTLAEVQKEVGSSGVDCTPVPAITEVIKTLSPACRDMVQYTYLQVRDGHQDVTVLDVQKAVVPKSIACKNDHLPPNVASVPAHNPK
jgi:hypothetical protein